MFGSMSRERKNLIFTMIAVLALLLTVGCKRADNGGGEWSKSSSTAVGSDEQGIPAEDTTPTPIPTPTPVPDDALNVEIGSSAFYNDCIYNGEDLVAYSSYDHISLPAEDSMAYPELALSLDQLSDEIAAGCAATFEECRSYFESDTLDGADVHDVRYCVDDDLTVTRADSVAVSILEYNYVNFGGVHPGYDYYGYSYDTRTGRRLTLKDVVNEEYYPTKLAETIKALYELKYTAYFVDDLRGYILSGIENDTLSWTLGYDGLRIYFNCYELASYADGMQMIYLSYESYSTMFKEQYLLKPQEYVTGFVSDHVLWYDLNGNGQTEEVTVYGEYHGDAYLTELVVTVGNDRMVYDDLYGWDEIPYLVHALDGNDYLYVFMSCDNNASVLNIYGLSAAGTYHVGSVDGRVKPSCVEDDWIFDHVCFNPSDFDLVTEHDFLGVTTETASYTVGEQGMPVRTGGFYELTFDYELQLTMDFDVVLTDEAGLTTGGSITLSEGDVITMKRFDGDSIADAQLSDGRWVRFYFDTESLWDKSFNGVDVDDLFIGIGYAG